MQANKVMTIDIETQNKPYFGAVASPRHPDNYVVQVGWVIDSKPFDGEIKGKRYASKDEAADWLDIPDDVGILVAHNAPYELDFALHTQRHKIEAFLKRGGRVFCTAYAHYLLSNQQDTYPALNEVAPMYGGTHKVDGIKELWNQGVLTADIDQDLLAEYLLGPGGDIANTRKVFWGQYQKLQKRGMWQMALVRMEGMLFCCEAMASGLHVSRDIAFAQMRLQEQRLNELLAMFREMRKDYPEDAEFKESSDYHMHAFVYGGPLKYKARRPYSFDGGEEKYEKGDFYYFGTTKTDPGSRIPVSSVDISNAADLAEHEHYQGAIVRYGAGKNKGMPKVFREDTAEVKLKWFELLHHTKGICDLMQLPDSVRSEFLDSYTGKRTLADGSLVISTATEPLEILAKRPEFDEEVRDALKALDEFNKLDKDLGTYYLREKLDEDGNVVKTSGMLQYLNELDKVHHNLNMASTGTTRLSSSKPNCQNLSRGDTSDVKNQFTSRFGNKGVIVEADYSALEVVTLAAFSKDSALVQALVDKIDMHCMRLAAKLKEPYEAVLRKCKDQTHPEHASYDLMRTLIKPRAFAYQYGATAMGISFSTGCTVEEAQEFIDNEKALFPEVERWYEEAVFPVVESNVKRHREEVDGVWRVFSTGTWQSPGGTTYEFRTWPKFVWYQGKRNEVMQFKPTQMRNYPIQGESGYFVQGVCGLLYRHFLAKDFWRKDGVQRAYIINQVHDAVYIDVHLDVLDEVCSATKRIMESLPEYFNKLGYDLQVPFPAAVEFGHTMKQKIHWHPGVLDEPGYTKEGKYVPSAREALAEWEAAMLDTVRRSREL